MKNFGSHGKLILTEFLSSKPTACFCLLGVPMPFFRKSSVSFAFASLQFIALNLTAFANSSAPAKEQGEEESPAPAAAHGAKEKKDGQEKDEKTATVPKVETPQENGEEGTDHPKVDELGSKSGAPDSKLKHEEEGKGEQGSAAEVNEHGKSENHPTTLSESKGTGLIWFAGAIVVMLFAIFLFT
jgi:hypothetical protein